MKWDCESVSAKEEPMLWATSGLEFCFRAVSSHGEAALGRRGSCDGHASVDLVSARGSLTSWLRSEPQPGRVVTDHWHIGFTKAFCMCILGLCLKSVLFPGLTSKLPHLWPRVALGLCSGPGSWAASSSSCPCLEPCLHSPHWACPGAGELPCSQAPVAQISSVFTGLINLGPLVPCL